MTVEPSIIEGLPPMQRIVVVEAIKLLANHNGNISLTLTKHKTEAGFVMSVDIHQHDNAAQPAKE